MAITDWPQAVVAGTRASCCFGVCLSAPQGLLFLFLKCDEMEHAIKNRYFLELAWLELLAVALLFLLQQSLISF